jgi:hypothetical protein
VPLKKPFLAMVYLVLFCSGIFFLIIDDGVDGFGTVFLGYFSFTVSDSLTKIPIICVCGSIPKLSNYSSFITYPTHLVLISTYQKSTFFLNLTLLLTILIISTRTCISIL